MRVKILFLAAVLITSFICGFDHLVGFYYLKNNYTIYAFNASHSARDEVYNYTARTKQILNGDIIPHETRILEYQGNLTPYISETLPSYVMAFFSIVAGSLEKGFIVADFILPVIVLCLAYYLILLLTKNPIYSIVGAIGTVLVRDFFVYFPYPIPIFKYLFLHEPYVDNLPITRSFHPQVSIIFYLISIICLYHLFDSKRSRWIILSGICIGLNFYNYIFYWTTIILAMIILFAINIKNKKICIRIFASLTVAFIIALPAIISGYLFSISPLSRDFIERSTGVRNEFPLPEAKRFIVLSILIFFLVRKKGKLLLLNIIVFSAAILPDLSYLLLKKDLEAIHWIWVAVMPVASILYYSLIYKLFFEKNKRIVI